MTFKLPQLPYAFDALEPHIDAQTMEIHYSKHHQGYLDKLNIFCEEHNIDTTEGIESIISVIDGDTDMTLRNNAGGYYNHMFFWEGLTPTYQEPSERWKHIVSEQQEGPLSSDSEVFKEQMVALGMSQFGSGWAWIVMKEDGTITGITTPNQDNPLMPVVIEKLGERYTPLFAIDVWEHAYYLKYQNRRKEYLHAILDHINWEVVETRYFDALRNKGIDQS